MKKLFLSMLVAVFCLTIFFGCAKKSTEPGETEVYFQVGNAYRVIQIIDEKKIKDCPIHVDTYVKDIKDKDEAWRGMSMPSKGLFFKDTKWISVDCVKALYSCLGLDVPTLRENFYTCTYSRFKTLNDVKARTEKFSLSDINVTENLVLGTYGDMTEYVVSFEDRSISGGARIGGGTFSAYFCEKPIVGVFEAEEDSLQI